MTTLRELTNRHRAQQILLRESTKRDVARLWPLLSWNRLDDSYPDLAAQMDTLVARNRQTSAGLASLYLKQARTAARVKGVQRVVLADVLPNEQLSASLQATSIAALKTSAKNAIAPELALANALIQTQGSMSRLVLLAGRQTITRTSVTDPSIVGWQRVGVGKCDFCRMLLERGAVYREDTVDFEAHDSCGCSGEPVYA